MKNLEHYLNKMAELMFLIKNKNELQLTEISLYGDKPLLRFIYKGENSIIRIREGTIDENEIGIQNNSTHVLDVSYNDVIGILNGLKSFLANQLIESYKINKDFAECIIKEAQTSLDKNKELLSTQSSIQSEIRNV